MNIRGRGGRVVETGPPEYGMCEGVLVESGLGF